MSRILFLASLVLTAGMLTGVRAEPDLVLLDSEKMLLALTNAEREKLKLPPLKPNPQLVRVARAHTTNMATTGRFDHTLDGQTPGDRLKKEGYEYARYAENIAKGDDARPQELFRWWMESPPHKANLLNGEFVEIGLGWGRAQNGVNYATQVFGKPLTK